MQAAFTSLLLDWVKIWDSGMIAVFTISPFPSASMVQGPFSISTSLPHFQHSQISPCSISSFSFWLFFWKRGVCWYWMNFPYVVAFSLLSFSSTSSQFIRMADSQICFLPICSSPNLLVDNVYIFSLLRINEALADTNSECFSDEIFPIIMSVNLFICHYENMKVL